MKWISIQKVSSAFTLPNFFGGSVNVYENVTNIVVSISNPRKPSSLQNAILINSHYDSVLCVSAMSDDAINVAVGMELIRNLLLLKDLEISFIFNFNGAEETILQAAHGFITIHKWGKELKHL